MPFKFGFSMKTMLAMLTIAAILMASIAASDIRPRVKRQTEETSTNGPGAEGEAEGEAPKKRRRGQLRQNPRTGIFGLLHSLLCWYQLEGL